MSLAGEGVTYNANGMVTSNEFAMAPPPAPVTVAAPATGSGAIGGTSGTGDSSLSLNLNGVDLNYDLGPSPSVVASQAYQFVGNSFNQDAAFVGNAITGADNLVSGLTAPLISGALDQSKTNDQVLPSLYQELMGQNYALGEQAVSAEQQTANASIQSSNASAQAAASAGGGCYITSAVCDILGLPDDCHTLTVLRAFRDGYLKATNVGRAFVAEYYATAPVLVARMKARADAREYFQGLYTRFILPALLAIESGDKARAFKIYRHMVYAVRAEN
jgi:hypothetical protein